MQATKTIMKASASMHTWFALVGIILWTGIYFSGFTHVNWLIYLPAVGFIFAAVTGIYLSLMGIIKLMELKIKDTSGKQSQ